MEKVKYERQRLQPLETYFGEQANNSKAKTKNMNEIYKDRRANFPLFHSD